LTTDPYWQLGSHPQTQESRPEERHFCVGCV
jgi:hypothetical protein